MAMRMGLMGTKVGMTQVFAEDGECIPVTVLKLDSCYVVGKRTEETDGYSAVIVGFGAKPERLAKKAEIGFFKKSGAPLLRNVQEFRLPAEEVEKFELGKQLKPADVFENGDVVDVVGTSKGKGYQGVIKRHNMHGTKATHGVHEVYRHGGSIGCRLTPGRVAKGKKMAGQMGNERVTIQNLQLLQILEEDDAVLIRGSIPGGKNGVVTLKKAATRTEYRVKGAGAGKQERSKNPLKASKQAAAGRA